MTGTARFANQDEREEAKEEHGPADADKSTHIKHISGQQNVRQNQESLVLAAEFSSSFSAKQH